MEPKISVIMPVYNGQKYLKEAIQSILDQTFSDFEFIIIDDGSTDNTENIIKGFQDSRIKYFKKSNSGIADTVNFGIKKSIGEFIARMDSDDFAMPNRLEKQIKFFAQNPKIALIGSYALGIDEEGKRIGLMNYPPNDWKAIINYSFLHNPFIHSTLMFRKDLVGSVGVYNKKYLQDEDYEFWTRIIYKYPCVNIPEPLIKYRKHGSQFTKKFYLNMKLVGLKVRFLALIRFFLTPSS